jgi:hypothetical protein
MNIKKTEEEIMKRIEFIEGRLNVLENALKQAMEKPFFERGKQIIKFIYIEKKVYTALLNELKSILYSKKILIVPVGGTCNGSSSGRTSRHQDKHKVDRNSDQPTYKGV